MRRWWVFVALLGALAMLPFAARQAAVAWQDYTVAKQQWADAQVQAQRLAKLRSDLQVFDAYENATTDLMQRAEAAYLSPLDWEERQVDVRRRELSRNEAAGFLSGAGRGPGYFFIPERFDLRTTQKNNDLFFYRQGDVNRLRLTLKGVYLARGKN